MPVQTVMDYLHSVSEADFRRELFGLLGDESDVDDHVDAAAKMRTLDPEEFEHEGRTNYVCYLAWKDDDEGVDSHPYVDVSLRGVGAPGEAFETLAIDFVSWAQVVGLRVEVDPAFPFATPARILAEIVWELTFYGTEEDDIDAVFEEVTDAVEETKTDTGIHADPAGHLVH